MLKLANNIVKKLNFALILTNMKVGMGTRLKCDTRLNVCFKYDEFGADTKGLSVSFSCSSSRYFFKNNIKC